MDRVQASNPPAQPEVIDLESETPSNSDRQNDCRQSTTSGCSSTPNRESDNVLQQVKCNDLDHVILTLKQIIGLFEYVKSNPNMVNFMERVMNRHCAVRRPGTANVVRHNAQMLAEHSGKTVSDTESPRDRGEMQSEGQETEFKTGCPETDGRKLNPTSRVTPKPHLAMGSEPPLQPTPNSAPCGGLFPVSQSDSPGAIRRRKSSGQSFNKSVARPSPGVATPQPPKRAHGGKLLQPLPHPRAARGKKIQKSNLRGIDASTQCNRYVPTEASDMPPGRADMEISESVVSNGNAPFVASNQCQLEREQMDLMEERSVKNTESLEREAFMSRKQPVQILRSTATGVFPRNEHANEPCTRCSSGHQHSGISASQNASNGVDEREQYAATQTSSPYQQQSASSHSTSHGFQNYTQSQQNYEEIQRTAPHGQPHSCSRCTNCMHGTTFAQSGVYGQAAIPVLHNSQFYRYENVMPSPSSCWPGGTGGSVLLHPLLGAHLTP